MANVRVRVKGMTCDHCSHRVGQAVKQVGGVLAAYVDLADGYVEVDFAEDEAKVADVVDAIRSAGYEAEIAQ